MSNLKLSDAEQQLLLKLSVRREDILRGALGEEEKEHLGNIRKCTGYLAEKYRGTALRYLFFAPADPFNRRGRLAFSDGDGEIYSVYCEDGEETVDDYFTKNCTARYRAWLRQTLQNEPGFEMIAEMTAAFSGLAGKDVTGNETIEQLLKMPGLRLYTDVSVKNKKDGQTVADSIKAWAEKYPLRGFYRIISGEEELTYFSL